MHLTYMRTDTNPLSGLDPLLSIDELAEYLGVPIKTIYEWRQTGRGPVCIRMGRHLKFAVSDVRDWIENQRETAPGRSAEKR
jgi:excisionase family DNA binding protein